MEGMVKIMSWNYGKTIDTVAGGIVAIKMTQVVGGLLDKTLNRKKSKSKKSKKEKLPRLF